MINSLFMLGSSYNKNRKISSLFMVAWLSYMFFGSNLSLGAIFPVVNALVFIGVTLLINCVKNRKANTVLSILSILIWSIVIDVICYFMYPTMKQSQNIFMYVYQGILFNYKYIFSNILAVCAINGIDWAFKKVSAMMGEKSAV